MAAPKSRELWSLIMIGLAAFEETDYSYSVVTVSDFFVVIYQVG